MRPRLLDGSEPAERDLYAEYADCDPWFGVVAQARRVARTLEEVAQELVGNVGPIAGAVSRAVVKLNGADPRGLRYLGEETILELGPRASMELWCENDPDDAGGAEWAILDRLGEALR